MDEHVRQRINQFFENGYGNKKDKVDVEHFMQLRHAATNKEACPGYGYYTYQYIKDYVLNEFHDECSGGKWTKVKSTVFKEADLKWLETYMESQEIAIPEAEVAQKQ